MLTFPASKYWTKEKPLQELGEWLFQRKVQFQGRPPTNLRPEQKLAMLTDKSWKFDVTLLEKYLELGEQHICNDREVDLAEIDDIEKQLIGHTSMWIKMWGIGEAHNRKINLTWRTSRDDQGK